jgi:hypothetical protein
MLGEGLAECTTTLGTLAQIHLGLVGFIKAFDEVLHRFPVDWND